MLNNRQQIPFDSEWTRDSFFLLFAHSEPKTVWEYISITYWLEDLLGGLHYGPYLLVNKTKGIRAILLDFAFNLDFYFEDIFRFGNISVLVTFKFLVTFQFWWHYSFSDILVLMTFQFWWYFSFYDISVLVTF